MTQVREAMIVAGGAGSRLRPLTATTPKPLLPFCGAPFLEGVVRRLIGVGVDRVLLVVGAHTAPFEVFAHDVGARLGTAIEVVPEPQPLDTAGGVRAALDRVTGAFLVLNGDILTDVDLASVIATHRRTGAGATIVLTRVEDTSTFGVCVRDGNRIVDFVEKPAPGTLPGQDAVNAGTYVLDPEVMARFATGRLSFEREVFPRLVADGVHVEGVVADGVWADLGTPDRLLEGHRFALDGSLRWPTLQAFPADAAGIRRGADVEVAVDAQLIGPVLLLPGSRVGAGAAVGPYTVVGQRCTVGAGAEISDSVLGPGSSVGDHARIRGLLTGVDARVGSAVVVAGGAVLGDDVVVRDGTVLPDGARVPVPADA